jgi:uncharacterized protein
LALLTELGDILGRRKFDKKIAASLLSVDQLVERYADLTSIFLPTAISGIAPDPDDDVVIGTALAGAAALIVTGDLRLLSVGEHRGVRIVSVRQALTEIDQFMK